MTMTKDEKRAAMAQVRTRVKAYFKGAFPQFNHLGDMPVGIEQARRVIIALQDMYEESRDKHRKASNLIAEQNDVIKQITAITQDLSQVSIQRQIIASEEKQRLANQVKTLSESAMAYMQQYSDRIKQLEEAIMRLELENSDLLEEKSALLTTLRTTLNE